MHERDFLTTSANVKNSGIFCTNESVSHLLDVKVSGSSLNGSRIT